MKMTPTTKDINCIRRTR